MGKPAAGILALGIALAGVLQGAAALTSGSGEGVNRYVFADSEVGCSAALTLEGQDLQVAALRLDVDPVNCDIEVDFTYRLNGWVQGEGTADAGPCPVGTARGTGDSGGGAWMQFGRGHEEVLVLGCGRSAPLLLDL